MTLRSILCDVTCVAALALSSTASAQYVLFDAPTDTISVPGQTVVGQSFTIEARFQMLGQQSDREPAGVPVGLAGKKAPQAVDECGDFHGGEVVGTFVQQLGS